MWENVSDWVESNLCWEYDKKLKPITLTPIQREALDALRQHKIVVVCVPKRQGKTMIAGAAALYTFFKISNSTTIILSTSKDHAAGVAFRRTREILLKTAQALSQTKDKQKPTPNVASDTQNLLMEIKESKIKISQNTIQRTIQIREEKFNTSIIETVPCVVEAVAGKVYDLLIIDELALIDDEEVVSVIMSQCEKPNSRILITSTASSKEHILYRLYEQSQHDETIHFIYRGGWEFYQSGEGNPLITKEFIERQQQLMIEPLFRLYYLNEFGAGKGDDRLFPNIDNVIFTTPIPPTPQALFPNLVNYQVFVGIDRALPYSKHGDQSAGVLLYKILLPNNEVKYLVGDAVIFPTGTFEEIWGWLQNIQQPITQVVFEVYQCYDLYEAAREKGIPTTLVHVNPTNKREAFNKLYSIVSKSQIIIPSHFYPLIDQLKEIRYKGGSYSAPAGGHDDLVYALLWAVDAATKQPIYPIFFDFFSPVG